MNRLTKSCVLAATLLTMALNPLAQVSAAPMNFASPVPQNDSYGQGDAYSNVEQVRHKMRHGGRHHYHRHHHHHNYKRHHRHRSNRHCYYSPRYGEMVCRPHHAPRRHHW